MKTKLKIVKIRFIPGKKIFKINFRVKIFNKKITLLLSQNLKAFLELNF